jgi:hypothetical protein
VILIKSSLELVMTMMKSDYQNPPKSQMVTSRMKKYGGLGTRHVTLSTFRPRERQDGPGLLLGRSQVSSASRLQTRGRQMLLCEMLVRLVHEQALVTD